MALLPALLIALAVGWIFAPAMQGGWLWDDDLTIVSNPLLGDLGGLRRIWLAPATPDYFPLTATMQWVQWHLWGDHTLGYHLTSLGLHWVSACLVWRVLSQLGLRQAWLGGLIFAIHPLAVESVAWISELKNTLSLPFLLLAMSAYLEFEGRADPPGPPRAIPVGPEGPPYLKSLACFLAAMLCKTSVVMFPAVLLLHAWWRRGRIARSDVSASLPFFGISLGLGLVTVWFQQHHALQAGILPLGGPLSRVANAGLAAGFYLAKSVLPVALLPTYPRWLTDPPALRQFLAAAVVAAVLASLWALRARQNWARTSLFGLAFILLNLAPVLGFVPASYFHISWVADHFMYVSLVGVAGLAAAGWQCWRAPRLARWVALSLLIVVLAASSRRYAGVFQSEEGLWRYTLEREPSSWIAANNLGKTVLKSGQADAAVPLLTQALRQGPAFATADIDLNLSLALAGSGRLFEAIRRSEEAAQLRPADAEIHSNLGNLLARAGRRSEAIGEYLTAVRLKPESAAIQSNLGTALTAEQRLPEAIDHFAEAVRLAPRDADARYNMGIALAQAGRTTESLAAFEAAVRLAPRRADAHNNLGIVLAGFGRFAEAKAQFAEAVRLQPDFGAARENLARATRSAMLAP